MFLNPGMKAAAIFFRIAIESEIFGLKNFTGTYALRSQIRCFDNPFNSRYFRRRISFHDFEDKQKIHINLMIQ